MTDQLSLFRFFSPADAVAASPQRHVVLAGRLVAYRLRRDRRRLTLRIDERGLAVGAPRQIALKEIETFLHQHAAWVVDKLDEHARRTTHRQVRIRDGVRLPLLGSEVTVRVTAGGNRGYWSASELWLAARPAADLGQLARRALQRRALEHFRPRLAALAAQLGRPVPPLGLSSARTRWGSCSARSGIRLNWRLIHLPPELIDYVIAHEAAHLVEMNHSPRFWAVVEALHPDWREARQELKRLGAALPLI